MPGMYELELGKAGYIIAHEMYRIKKGESVIITVDSVMDFKPVTDVAKAAEAAGGKVMVAWHSTPSGYGKVADPQLPESLKKGIPAADVYHASAFASAPRARRSAEPTSAPDYAASEFV